jgi:hypothetical protein
MFLRNFGNVLPNDMVSNLIYLLYNLLRNSKFWDSLPNPQKPPLHPVLNQTNSLHILISSLSRIHPSTTLLFIKVAYFLLPYNIISRPFFVCYMPCSPLLLYLNIAIQSVEQHKL